ncbi:MAG: amino acid ABC transporter permease [Oscillospiraceae bacterium]|nr:amino acid ABC transporter permease [Oscillospiraceae bacterium]MBQ4000556.1 amino acid ABC transporter permease [Oscillospiraceae bacterium]
MSKFSQLLQDVLRLCSKYYPIYLSGMKNTVLLALIGTVLGCVIGFVCGVLNTIPLDPRDPFRKRALVKCVRGVIRAYVELFRGTPMVLQAVFIYYALPYFTDGAARFSSVWAASILVVSVNTGAYMTESVRGGIISVDPGQVEGAMAIGLTHVQAMMYVILPQAVRSILPQIGNNFIINLKDTSVMFMISFTDFFAAHRGVVGATYLYFPSAVIEMIGYLTMTLISSFFLRRMEQRLEGSSSFELVVADPLTLTSGVYRNPESDELFRERSRDYTGKD